MMEKQNRMVEKKAAGDARDFDDIVDGATAKMERGAGHSEKDKNGPRAM